MKRNSKCLLVLVVFLCTTLAFSQSTITGKVLGSDFNEPLPGANVVEKGTSNGATTNFDGNFTIKA
ncbi:carboxypeptidase-like regulatory domain-containing protein, partial [Psychroserpens sp.]|uniref:carboxypeptidase-like regulatory domain-containing protein n=1 Tax=Psychroserpens sp. TaxID=2020870 RepID=UPI0039E6B4AC